MAGEVLTVKKIQSVFGYKRYTFYETDFHFYVGGGIEHMSTLVESPAPIYKEVVTKVIERGYKGNNKTVFVATEYKSEDEEIHLELTSGTFDKQELANMIDVLQQIYEVM